MSKSSRPWSVAAFSLRLAISDRVLGLFWTKKGCFWPKTAQIWKSTSRPGAYAPGRHQRVRGSNSRSRLDWVPSQSRFEPRSPKYGFFVCFRLSVANLPKILGFLALLGVFLRHIVELEHTKGLTRNHTLESGVEMVVVMSFAAPRQQGACSHAPPPRFGDLDTAGVM